MVDSSSSSDTDLKTPKSPFLFGPFASALHRQVLDKSCPRRTDELLLNFISQTLHHDYRNTDLRNLLHDGVIPCRMIQKLYPSARIASKHLRYAGASREENIRQFLQACNRVDLIDGNFAPLENLERISSILVTAMERIKELAPTSVRATCTPLAELFPVSVFTATLERSAAAEAGAMEHTTKHYSLKTSRISHRVSAPPRLKASSNLARPNALITRSNREPAHESLSLASTVVRECVQLSDGQTFLIGNVIGRGQFGTVYRAIDTSTGCIVAIKRISIGKAEADGSSLLHEVELLKQLSSKHIVKYYGFVRDERYLHIVVEYVEIGSLLSSIKAFGCFNERLCAAYTSQILLGLIYLHEQDVIHCDLKCANVLTTKDGDVKLSDFGVSLNSTGQTTIKGEVNGTPNWLAPEIITLRGTCKSSDIWALGCTVLEMIQGKPPYDSQVTMAAMYSIVEDAHPPLPTAISDDLRNFLLACFRKEPRDRPTALTMQKHPWIAHQIGSAVPYVGPKSEVSANRSCKPLSSQAPAGASSIEASNVDNVPVRGNICQTHQLRAISIKKGIICSICQLSVKRALYCAVCHQVMHAHCNLLAKGSQLASDVPTDREVKKRRSMIRGKVLRQLYAYLHM